MAGNQVTRNSPWLLDATVGPRIMGPNELGWLEHAIATLDGTGLDGGEQMDAVVAVLGQVRTIAQQSRTPTGTPHDPEEQLSTSIAELLRTHGDRYPALTAALASASSHGRQDSALDFGLERIFDGLGVLITRRSGTDKNT
jgi:hypothetical protein